MFGFYSNQQYIDQLKAQYNGSLYSKGGLKASVLGQSLPLGDGGGSLRSAPHEGLRPSNGASLPYNGGGGFDGYHTQNFQMKGDVVQGESVSKPQGQATTLPTPSKPIDIPLSGKVPEKKKTIL